MGILQGKKILITGVASDRSIAWGITRAMHEQGAQIALTYLNQKLKARTEKLASKLGIELLIECDVSKDENIRQTFSDLSQHWDYLDGLVHSIAFSNKNELDGTMVDSTTKEGFALAHDISSYSFVALAREAQPMLQRGSSLMCLSYLGGQRTIPHYNVMGLAKASLEASVRSLAYDLGAKGIRTNCISAGPVKTLAAKGIKDFNYLLEYGEKNSPSKRNITAKEIGNVAAFLGSDLSSGINGEIIYVDGGYNIMGMGIDGVEP